MAASLIGCIECFGMDSEIPDAISVIILGISVRTRYHTGLRSGCGSRSTRSGNFRIGNLALLPLEAVHEKVLTYMTIRPLGTEDSDSEHEIRYYRIRKREFGGSRTAPARLSSGKLTLPGSAQKGKTENSKFEPLVCRPRVEQRL